MALLPSLSGRVCSLRVEKATASSLAWSCSSCPSCPQRIFSSPSVLLSLRGSSTSRVKILPLSSLHSLGYAVLISIGLSRLGRLRAPCLLLLLVVFSIRTVQRNRDWESRETLFVAGLRTLPHNAKMHYNYANLQKDLGNTNLAKYHYEEAIR
ncbi:Transmembrane and TPR repeat-containing protein 1 [Penaeus vannamei]|uniref:Transmembrane and TPR repeat-containing protein 1 n=1 Tax=Penaeus vannamei TaxID=6689 RepID=A0A3R7SHC1_PENVA|nr:Transmembrane and TPR repeat-containing protein 1 [Penaeus vannamei]